MLRYVVTESMPAGERSKVAYVIAETSTQAETFARGKLGFAMPKAKSIDVQLIPAGAEVLVVPAERQKTEEADGRGSLLMRRPILTIACGVFLGLLMFMLFGMLVSWLMGSPAGWPVRVGRP